jgi:alpha-amylase/alpha-mannosidase (GH57 family)
MQTSHHHRLLIVALGLGLLASDYAITLSQSDHVMPPPNPSDVYPPAPDRKPIYLNIIWHQHQPLYINPEKDQLSGPWVRTHATKDYYDMAAILRDYPDVHCTINLSSSLLNQLLTYYVDRLGPFIDTKLNEMDVRGFLKAWKGKTDPWIDLMLKNTAKFDSTDIDYLYRNPWNAFGISPVQIARFPQYAALQEKLKGAPAGSRDVFTEQEMREIKFWFFLADFDPDFLRGPVTLPDGSVCDLSTYVEYRSDGKFYLRRPPTEGDCRRMVVEAYKVMAAVIPIHRELRLDMRRGTGQVEIITTPYDHPILPLIFNSDLARVCQPHDSLPPRFAFPRDAAAQVTKSVVMYRKMFGASPEGMWPAEGSVAQPVLPLFAENGIRWIASDVQVLDRSEPRGMPNTSPYRFPAGRGGEEDSSAWEVLVFRDTDLSDRIGFTYQNYEGEVGTEDFIRSILARAPRVGDPDALLTVILDGENAWEWYKKDMDGKAFLHALYRKLSVLERERRVITVTTSEYLAGDPSRGVPPHPTGQLPAMKNLWPGSWINANFDTWIGEQEENTAWEYLLRVRTDLGGSGISEPDPMAPPPKQNTRDWFGWKAWEEMYAAEGSDWFWWYGDDQTAPGGDKPFDTAYLIHLRNVYSFARKAGSSIRWPGLAPIIRGRPEDNAHRPRGNGDVMAK